VCARKDKWQWNFTGNTRKFTVSFAFFGHTHIIKYQKPDFLVWMCSDNEIFHYQHVCLINKIYKATNFVIITWIEMSSFERFPTKKKNQHFLKTKKLSKGFRATLNLSIFRWLQKKVFANVLTSIAVKEMC